jgi:hypothetical protein
MSIANRTLLRNLGVASNDCSVVNFPTTLHPKYLQAWATFVASPTCYELYNRHTDADAAMLEVVMAFVASLESKRLRPFIGSVAFSAAKLSADKAVRELDDLVRKSLDAFVRQRGILNDFNKVAVNLWPDYDYDKVISAHVPEYVDVYYSVVLRRKGPKPADMTAALKLRSQHWLSKVSVPSKLLSPTDIPALRNAKWPSIDQLTQMPSRWVEVVPDISVARAEGNVLVFRTRIYPKTVVYIDHRKISDFFRMAAQRLSKK